MRLSHSAQRAGLYVFVLLASAFYWGRQMQFAYRALTRVFSHILAGMFPGLAGLLLACVASPASATSLFTATVNTNSSTAVGPPTQFTDSGSNANGSYSGTSYAGSFVGVMAIAGGPFLGQVYTDADSNIGDVTITGPGGPGAMVNMTVTLPFIADFSGIYATVAGTASASGFSGGLQFKAVFDTKTYQANFTGSGNPGSDIDTLTSVGATWTLSAVPTYGTIVDVGGTIHNDDWAITGSLVLTQMFPVNMPFSIEFDVIGNCGGGGGNSQIEGSCAFNALDPWGIIPGFSSFDLPPDYSIDAPSIGLVNGVVSGTPLPATLPLFASGLGALGLIGWRRKRKAAALAA